MKRARSASQNLEQAVVKYQKTKQSVPKTLSFKGNKIMPQSTGNGTELKFIDNFPGEVTLVNGTGIIECLNLCAQGSDFTQRIGRKITMKNINIRYELTEITDTTSVTQWVRVLIVYDRATDGALPAITDVLTSDTSVAFMNLNNRERFWVLMDETTTLNEEGPAGAYVQRFIKLGKKGVDVVYNNTTGVIGAISTGGIYAIIIPDAFQMGSDVQINFSARIKFTDD